MADRFAEPEFKGLYPYGAMVRLNGEELDQYYTGPARYFENGWGKMYLDR